MNTQPDDEFADLVVGKSEWLDDNGVRREPSAIKKDQAKDAYLAYRDETDGWRSQLADLFVNLAMQASYSSGTGGEFRLESDDYLSWIFSAVANMLEDTARGAVHPLAMPVKKTGRKPLNTLDRERQMWLAVMAGVCLNIATQQGESTEFGYRMAARLVTKAGYKIRWNTIRSSYLNRRRNGYENLVDSLVREPAADIDTVEIFARIIARNQNTPVF